MRQETITKTYLQFNELTEQQKNEVLDNLRDINVDFNWWECTKEDYHVILNILGFDNVRSQFSGFWSQGDGASFRADFRIFSKDDKMRDRLAKLKDYAPRFFKDNKSLLESLIDLDYQLSGYHDDIEISQSGRHCHEFTMQCDNENLLEVARSLAKKYYRTLENEYESQTSDDAIKETIISNEYEFDADTLKIA